MNLQTQSINFTKRADYTAPSFLTKRSKQDVRNMVDYLKNTNSEKIIIDMSELENIDLWGAQQLVKTARKLKSKNKDISLLSRRDKSTSLLLMLRINHIMDIVTTNSKVAGIPNQKWA